MEDIRQLLSFTDKIFSPPQQQSVIVYFYNEINDFSDLHNFEMKLDNLFAGGKEGSYDGHEVALDLSHGALFFYGPNAEILFKAVKPILETQDFLKGATAVLTFEKEMSIEVILGTV